MSTEGVKADSGKRRFSLFPLCALTAIVDVLEFGARKYSPGNWMTVPDARTRYWDAAVRHLVAWREGERLDPESGLPHLAHAGCCVIFLLALDENKP